MYLRAPVEWRAIECKGRNNGAPSQLDPPRRYKASLEAGLADSNKLTADLRRRYGGVTEGTAADLFSESAAERALGTKIVNELSAADLRHSCQIRGSSTAA